MSIPEKYHHAQQNAAGEAIRELLRLGEGGNREALEALRNVALLAIGALDSIDPGDVPQHSRRWPVALDAMKETRAGELAGLAALGVGSAIGIRTEGKNRGFNPGQAAGLALKLFQMIEPVRLRGAAILDYLKRHPESAPNWRDHAATLPPLAHGDSLKAWEIVAYEAFLECRMGDLTDMPLPECAQSKVGKDTDGNGSLRSAESAIRGKISDGLKSLIR